MNNNGHQHKEHSCSCCSHEHEQEHEQQHKYAHIGKCDCCHEHEGDDRKKDVVTMAVSLVIAVLAFAFSHISSVLSQVLFLFAYMICGYDVLLSSAKKIVKGKLFDEQFLMSIATIGAFIIGEYAEAIAVMLFYKLGEMLQDSATDKSRQKIEQLISLAPETARILRDGHELSVSPDDIVPGDTVIVRAGERIPVDGISNTDAISLDMTAITGESVPQSIKNGDRIFSGSIVQNGVLSLTATKHYCDSTVANILEMVENAIDKKSKTESFITKFSKIYTPAVVALAVLIAVIPPLFVGNFYEYLHRSLVFLVVSCPCALVLSIPIAYFAGIGACASRGILIKGGNYLDALSKAETAVFDKTGTLTKGSFEVTDIILSEGVSEKQLCDLAGNGEAFSNHPIAISLAKLVSSDVHSVSNQKEISGQGTVCTLDQKTLLCGNKLLMNQNGIYEIFDSEGKTAVHVAYDGKYMGCIVLSDVIKDDSKKAIKELKTLGIKNCIMLTGDKENVAKDIADELGISDWRAELLPSDKAHELEKIKKTCRGNVVFAGDGINDAPVIATADVGVAMGAFGSDAAINAADVVLMKDSLCSLATSVRISKSVRKKVVANIIFILLVKALILIASAAGCDYMWLGVFADIGTALIATANSARILKEKF